MKIEVYQCETCNSIIKSKDTALTLRKLVVGELVEDNELLGPKLLIDEDHDFCGESCLLQYISKKLHPDLKEKE
jgi:hypothetical protein